MLSNQLDRLQVQVLRADDLQRELSEAISLIERVADGRLVEVAGKERPAPIGAWAEMGPGCLVPGEGLA